MKTHLSRCLAVVGLVLSLSTPSGAAVAEFDRFFVDVPPGWLASQEGRTVILLAEDKSSSLTLTSAPKDDGALAAVAGKIAKSLNATLPAKDKNGDYVIPFANTHGIDGFALISERQEDVVVIVVTGKNPAIMGIINSVKEK